MSSLARILWPLRHNQHDSSRGTGSGKAHNLFAHPYARSITPKRAPRQAVSVAVTGMKSDTGMPKKK